MSPKSPKVSHRGFTAHLVTHHTNKEYKAIVLKVPGQDTHQVLWMRGENCYRTDSIPGRTTFQVLKATQADLLTAIELAENGLRQVRKREPAV